MATLKELLSLPGAIAAGKFDSNGNLCAYAGDISEKAAEIAGLMAAANKAIANMQAKGFSTYTGKEGFYPVQGFAVAAGKYAACIAGNVGVFVELDKADFDKIFETIMP